MPKNYFLELLPSPAHKLGRGAACRLVFWEFSLLNPIFIAGIRGDVVRMKPLCGKTLAMRLFYPTVLVFHTVG